MTVKEYLDAGELSEAICHINSELRADPQDLSKRTFLFELLCCAGDLDRAAKHLDLLTGGDSNRQIAIQAYRDVLEGEKKRRLLFAEGLVPGLPKRVPAYTDLHLQAIRRVGEGDYAAARTLLEEGEAVRSPVAGTINGEPFDDLRDADDILGPFLEVIVKDSYSWIPWEVVRSVSIQEPINLRDLIWIPAHVELAFGELGEVFLPVQYAGTYMHQNDQVKLGRVTEWRDDTEGLALASGQKLLTDGENDWPLLEIRQLEIEPSGGA
jgi:type VI secretion system protein ImpE